MGRDRRSVRRLTALTTAALVLALTGSIARGQSADKQEEARRHYDKGEAYRQAGAHDKSIEEYQAAYALVPRPALLFNIGLAHENAGDAARAVEYYGRFLATGPQGAAADEALARKTALERRLAAELSARLARDEASAATAKRKGEAARQRGLAADLAKKGDHAAAATAYRAAFQLDADPEILFDLGVSLQAQGDRKQALATFERYRVAAPGAPRAGDAIERIAVLERAIAGTDRPGARRASPGTTFLAPAGQVEERSSKPKNRVLMLSLATAAIGAGVLLDTIPDSSGNHQLDGLDFAPLGLYGLGSYFAFRGIF